MQTFAIGSLFSTRSITLLLVSGSGMQTGKSEELRIREDAETCGDII